MAISIPWARTLVVGDYVSPVEIPTLNDGNTIDAYLATLARLRPLLAKAEHVVPGHGAVIESARALSVLEGDVGYLTALRLRGADADLPVGRRRVSSAGCTLRTCLSFAEAGSSSRPSRPGSRRGVPTHRNHLAGSRTGWKDQAAVPRG